MEGHILGRHALGSHPLEDRIIFGVSLGGDATLGDILLGISVLLRGPRYNSFRRAPSGVVCGIHHDTFFSEIRRLVPFGAVRCHIPVREIHRGFSLGGIRRLISLG
ncbi:hypothetical protein ACFYUK_30245 [Nonomuraea wenchangensis]